MHYNNNIDNATESSMQVTVRLPCHDHQTRVQGSIHFLKTGPFDRKCPHCGCWWRVDVEHKMTNENGTRVHQADLTQIGTLAA
jgi:hypothetical protein